MGPHPEYLNKYLFKEDYGYVSFTSFEYCEKASDLEKESIEYLDFFFGVYNDRKWVVLDESKGNQPPSKEWCLAYVEKEPLLCSISKPGSLLKSAIKVHYDGLYSEASAIELGEPVEEPFNLSTVNV